jgi:hypothetical protein
MNKKNLAITLMIGIVSNIFLMNNAFAATESKIEVNDLLITITKDLGATDETYTVTTNDSLKNFRIFFSNDNNVEVTNVGVDSWNVSVKYKGSSYSTSSSFSTIEIDGKPITINVISSQEIDFTIDKSLSDSFFNKILDNHEPFTLSAESITGKTINTERTVVSGGNDRYIFSSNTELSNARVVDGTDNIVITWNGGGYDVSGQYKGITGSTSVSVGGTTLVSYGSIEVAISVGADRKTITLDADPAIVQGIAQKLLDEKRNITEVIVDNSIFEIPSNSNISSIKIPAGITDPKIQFTVNNDQTLTNKEITIDDSSTGMQVVIPTGTTITGPVGWDGIVQLPRVSTATLQISGYTTDINSVIEIGLTGNSLTFDQPIKLIFPNKVGKRIGFIINGVFAEITTICSIDNLPSGANECKADAGVDLIVLTKHFTKFVVYTQTIVSTGGGGGESYYSDTTAPSISNINITNGNNSAVITWNTNESSLTWLLYGTSTIYGQENKSTSYNTIHSVALNNLLPTTTYHYQIKSRDNSGNMAVSTDQTFTTSTNVLIGDLNNDQKVDKYDFSLMMANWGKTGAIIGDLNNDQKVDKYDFSLIMANWNK